MYDHNLFAYIQLVYLDTPVLSNGYGFVYYEGKWGKKGAEKKNYPSQMKTIFILNNSFSN